ncbi:MAG: hypothetical protein HOM11_16525 [Methylococcales bacterium]|nr:hypothetical protein [Methylococcales bacterium]MBT7443841.1 hypothetical protein [Methylococcales bacterium]
MSQILNISATDYCRSLKLHELDDSVLQALPVSSYPLPDGTHKVISDYHSQEWRLEDARFPSNTKESHKKIRFQSIPNQFVAAVKLALKDYDVTNSPEGATLIGMFNNCKPFLLYLNDIGLQSTNKISPLVCANYVHQCKQAISERKKPLAKMTLTLRFLAVEKLYQHLKGTQWAFEHPWVEASAAYLAGNHSQGKKIGKTPIIPDDQLQILVQHCHQILEQAEKLMALNVEIEQQRKLYQQKYSIPKVNKLITKNLLKPNGYSGKRAFNALHGSIPDAMAIIILTFSGIRNHEFCAIQTDAYRIEDNEEDIY